MLAAERVVKSDGGFTLSVLVFCDRSDDFVPEIRNYSADSFKALSKLIETFCDGVQEAQVSFRLPGGQEINAFEASYLKRTFPWNIVFDYRQEVPLMAMSRDGPRKSVGDAQEDIFRTRESDWCGR
jgi:hypothetical protein